MLHSLTLFYDWLIKAKVSSGKLGEKEEVQITSDGVSDGLYTLFPYPRAAAKKLQVLDQRWDKETQHGKVGFCDTWVRSRCSGTGTPDFLVALQHTLGAAGCWWARVYRRWGEG